MIVHQLKKLLQYMQIFLLFIFAVSFRVQDCKSVYGSAFERSTISGKPPKKILDETGTQVEVPAKKQSTLFIYIEGDIHCQIQAHRIWIEGIPFELLQEEITHTPVILQNIYPGRVPDTLVRKTNRQVFRIQPSQQLKVSPDKKLRKKLKASKILVEYSYKTGTGSIIITDIKRLTPLVLQ